MLLEFQFILPYAIELGSSGLLCQHVIPHCTLPITDSDVLDLDHDDSYFLPRDKASSATVLGLNSWVEALAFVKCIVLQVRLAVELLLVRTIVNQSGGAIDCSTNTRNRCGVEIQ